MKRISVNWMLWLALALQPAWAADAGHGGQAGEGDAGIAFIMQQLQDPNVPVSTKMGLAEKLADLKASQPAASMPMRVAANTGGGDDRERIRSIVREVLREYAATLGDRAASPGAKAMLREINQSNRAFMRANKPEHFAHFRDGQHPRATVVSCSDSRVHSHALDASPDGDLFMIRNIGNQMATAEGSVEYGVHHLHTPLLLIIGHSACGAIKAAAGDYSKESGPIRAELDTIQIPKGEPGMASIKLNVNNQVRYAMSKFEEEVLSGKLVIIGAVYDFRNDLGQGLGRLNIININGETEAGKIAGMDIMQDLDAPEPKAARSRRSAPAAHH